MKGTGENEQESLPPVLSLDAAREARHAREGTRAQNHASIPQETDEVISKGDAAILLFIYTCSTLFMGFVVWKLFEWVRAYFM